MFQIILNLFIFGLFTHLFSLDIEILTLEYPVMSSTTLNHHGIFSSQVNDPKYCAVRHTLAVVHELQKGNYDPGAVAEYTDSTLRLTETELGGYSKELDAEMHTFYEKLKDRTSYRIENCLIYAKNQETPFASISLGPEIFSSFQKHFPDMPLTAPVWEQELAGYEMDRLFGYHLTFPTVGAKFRVNGQECRGTIKMFSSEAKPAGSGYYYLANGAEMLMGIPKWKIHHAVLSGLVKGICGGHCENYLFDGMNGLYEGALKEILLPYNRKHPNIIFGRMWILGLPQSALPFDRACLMLMTHPSLKPLLQIYQQVVSKTYHFSPYSYQAQIERLDIMQSLCRKELKKSAITLTPRQLYFAVYGGEHLWKKAKKKRYPAIVAFDRLISDPHQVTIKNFEDLEGSIEECFLLDAPLDDSEKSLHYWHNLRKLEGLEP